MSFTEDQVVFNVVWTGRTFDDLRPFVASQVAHSGARFRFVVNACPPDQREAMEHFAAAHPGRVVEVREVATDRMIRHGAALDAVLADRDDGALFALIDPDIVARGPFLGPLLDRLGDHHAVTSGREVWAEGNVRPAAHPGVNGEHFFDQDGFTFGSPHLALYRRDALVDTMRRWDVGFASAGNDISEGARAALASIERDYWVYDTAKIVNILLQVDGGRLAHTEVDSLLHVGGVAHFLAPPASAPAAQDRPPRWGEDDAWVRDPVLQARAAGAAYAATLVRDLAAGRPASAPPDEITAAHRGRLDEVRSALIAALADDRTPVASEQESRA